MVNKLKNLNFEAFGGQWSPMEPILAIIRQKSKISNIEHNCTLSNRNFILKMKKSKNLGFEPVHPKNVLLASVWYTEFPVYFFLVCWMFQDLISDFHRSIGV
jgi:hypothetical protein